MVQNQYDAIIIGAGHNGLVTAGYLAKDGLSVLVLERLEKIGGAVTTDEFSPGFNGPMCADICYLLQGKVIDDLNLREHGFELVHHRIGGDNDGYLHPFPDGAYMGGPGIKTSLDMANQIRQFSEHDARSYFEWTSFWEQASGILYPYFLTEPPTIAELVTSVRGTRQEEVLEKMLTWSYMDLLEDHFEDEHVKAYFLSPDIESDPRSPGSMLGAAMVNIGQFNREQDQGTPRMSMGTITDAMAKAATSFGAEIRTGAPVKEVIVEDGEAKGVRLDGGDEIRSFLVVSNADPKRTYTTLVQPEDIGEDMVRRVKRLKTTAAVEVKLLSAMKEVPDFSRYLGQGYDRNSIQFVTIMPSVEYFLQSWDDAQSGKPSSCPIMIANITSVAEPNLIPKGGHVMSTCVRYTPPHLREGTWDEVREEVGEQLIDTLTEYAPNFRESLVDYTLQTPLDFERRVGFTDGNIRHLDMAPTQMLSQRPSYRSPIKNFYLCSAGTHPMGEVTGAPGHNAAHAILKDLQKVAP